MKRRFVAAASVGLVLGLGGGAAAWVFGGGGSEFRLAEPAPTTVRDLGRIVRPPTHACEQGSCFSYLGGWCQSPCSTYRVRATLVSVKPINDRNFGGYLVVLRDGRATIVGRLFRRPAARVGDQVSVSGVLFFPSPRDRDGKHAANGAELSPVLTMAHV